MTKNLFSFYEAVVMDNLLLGNHSAGHFVGFPRPSCHAAKMAAVCGTNGSKSLKCF